MANAVRLTGSKTDQAVFDLMRRIKRQNSWAAKAQLARIVENEFQYNGSFEILIVDGASGTASEFLGPGVFYLRLDSGADAFARAEGGVYNAEAVSEDGSTASTDLRLVTRGLPAFPNGFLAYSTALVDMPDVISAARRPRDTEALAESIANIMKTFGAADRGQCALYVLSLLNTSKELGRPAEVGFADLSPDELMDTMERLQRKGLLGRFLNLIAVDTFRAFLEAKEVDWQYVLDHWEYSTTDSAKFYAGFMLGAGQNVADVVVMLGTLSGAALSTLVDHSYLEELAADARKMGQGLKTLLAAPITTAEKGFDAFRDSVQEAIWKLNFFEAGRLLGNATVFLLTLPEAVASLPKAAQAALQTTLKITAITARTLLHCGFRLRQLVKAAANPIGEIVQQGNYLLIRLEDRLALQAIGGGVRGEYPIGNLMEDIGEASGSSRTTGTASRPVDFAALESDASLPQLEKNFDDLFRDAPDAPLEKGSGRKPASPRGKKGRLAQALELFTEQMEGLVADAIIYQRKAAGKQWQRPNVFGTRLHSTMKTLILEYWGATMEELGLILLAERPIWEFTSVPEAVKKMTVRKFLETSAGYGLDAKRIERALKGGDETRKGLDMLVGDLKPDLVISREGQRIVWDLTAKNNAEHLSKTMLYTAVLDDGRTFTVISETYWQHFKDDFSLADFYGFAAGKDALGGTPTKDRSAEVETP